MVDSTTKTKSTATLTANGMDWARRLAVSRKPITGPNTYSADCFDPISPEEGWSFANDVISLLAGYWDTGPLQVASESAEDIAVTIRAYIELHPVVLEEICSQLIRMGLLAGTPTLRGDEVDWCMKVAHSLGNKMRVQILIAVGEESHTSRELCKILGDLPAMTVRYHLHALTELGLVQAERSEETRKIGYSLGHGVFHVYARRIIRSLVTF